MSGIQTSSQHAQEELAPHKYFSSYLLFSILLLTSWAGDKSFIDSTPTCYLQVLGDVQPLHRLGANSLRGIPLIQGTFESQSTYSKLITPSKGLVIVLVEDFIFQFIVNS